MLDYCKAFSHTEPLFNYFSGTETRIDLIPAFCTLNLPLFLRVDHLGISENKKLLMISFPRYSEKCYYVRIEFCS